VQHAATDEDGRSNAHGDAAEKETYRCAAARGRKIVADQRDRRRREHRFTQPDDDSGGEQLLKGM
jgi:hypothetical protein